MRKTLLRQDAAAVHPSGRVEIPVPRRTRRLRTRRAIARGGSARERRAFSSRPEGERSARFSARDGTAVRLSPERPSRPRAYSRSAGVRAHEGRTRKSSRIGMCTTPRSVRHILRNWNWWIFLASRARRAIEGRKSRCETILRSAPGELARVGTRRKLLSESPAAIHANRLPQTLKRNGCKFENDSPPTPCSSWWHYPM